MMNIAMVEANAMQLNEAERALLADRLPRSITRVPPDRLQAWNDEADSRLAAYHSGEMQAINGSTAMDDLLRRFSE